MVVVAVVVVVVVVVVAAAVCAVAVVALQLIAASGWGNGDLDEIVDTCADGVFQELDADISAMKAEIQALTKQAADAAKIAQEALAKAP